MKGVSEFVVVLIILIIVIGSILVVWLFYNIIFGSVTTSENTPALGEALSSCMKIDSASGNKIYLRNCGTGTVRNDSTSVYMDEAPIKFTMTPSSIGKGQIAEIALSGLWEMSMGNHKIRISSKAGEVQRYVKVVLPDSCVLDLEFDEGSGTDTYDSSGNRNNGTLYNDTFHSFGGNLFECSNPPTNGCPKWVDGKFGKAIEFDSSYDYVEVPDSASLDSITNTKDATWVFWFKLKSLNFPNDYPTFLGKNFTDIYKEYTIRINNGSEPLFTKVLTFRLANGTDSEGMNCSKTDWNVGEWYHVTVNYMNATKNANIYIDGVTCRSYNFTYNGLLTDNVATLFIGDSTENYGFNGTMDDVRIFNKALTPDETVSLTLGELT